jgi:hypothetical protein
MALRVAVQGYSLAPQNNPFQQPPPSATGNTGYGYDLQTTYMPQAVSGTVPAVPGAPSFGAAAAAQGPTVAPTTAQPSPTPAFGGAWPAMQPGFMRLPFTSK